MVGLVTHFSVYISCITGVYLAIKTEMMNESMVEKIMWANNKVITFFGMEEKKDIDTSMALTTAWITAKMAEPIRLPLTIFISKMVLKYMK